jgi:hypothetical protein
VIIRRTAEKQLATIIQLPQRSNSFSVAASRAADSTRGNRRTILSSTARPPRRPSRYPAALPARTPATAATQISHGSTEPRTASRPAVVSTTPPGSGRHRNSPPITRNTARYTISGGTADSHSCIVGSSFTSLADRLIK